MHYRSLLAFAALILAMAPSCKKPSLDSLSDGMTFSLSPEAYLTHKVNVNVLNGNARSGTIPNGTITISGTDADKVYEINGSRKFNLSEQMARLVVSPGETISAADPLQFMIHVSAPGFIPMSREVLVTSLDSMTTYTMGMIEIAAPPAGISLTRSQVEVNAGTSTIIAPYSVQVPQQTSIAMPQQSRLMLPEGTTLLDKSAKALKGMVEVEMIHFNHTVEEARIGRVQSVTSKPVTVERNNKQQQIAFLPLAELDIHMRSGSQQVKTFSKPITGQVDIDANTINYANGRAVQPGDPLEVYSQSDGDEVWHYEGTVQLTASGTGKLTAEFPIKHLSTFALVPPFNNCPRNLTIQFTKYCSTGGNKRNYNSNTLHYITIHEAGVPGEPILASFENVPVDNGISFRLPNPLPDVKVHIRVWEYDTKAINDHLNGRVVGQLLNVQACVSSARVILDIPGVTGRDIMSFKLVAVCEVGNQNIRYAHDGRVQFKLSNNPSDPWRDMGTSKSGDLVTDRLNWDISFYLFKTIISGKVNGRGSIESVEKTRSRNTNRAEFVNSPLGSSFWNFGRKNWIVPVEECDEICEYFGY